MDLPQQPTAPDDARDARWRQGWIDKGFDPDLPIHEYFGCFSIEAARESLFSTTYSKPKPVYLTNEDVSVNLPLVIYLATPMYVPSESGISYDDHPDWYFEAWVMNPGIAPEPAHTQRRIRICVFTLGNGEFSEDDMFEWQEIPLGDPGARRVKNWR